MKALGGRTAIPISELTDPVVYRLYDKSGGLLYVGKTVALVARQMGHRDDKPWWPEVAFLTIESFPDQATCARAELMAIQAERPRYNRAGHMRQLPLLRLGPPGLTPAQYARETKKLFAAMEEEERVEQGYSKRAWKEVRRDFGYGGEIDDPPQKEAV